VNGAQIAGHIALIDRGTCTFVDKAKRAQDAGAIAVIIGTTPRALRPGWPGAIPRSRSRS
jgi:hypothetical protein